MYFKNTLCCSGEKDQPLVGKTFFMTAKIKKRMADHPHTRTIPLWEKQEY